MKICIVGNSESILDKENGTYIDTFDKVLRCNRCKVRGYEKYVGSRYDIHCQPYLSNENKYTELKNNNCEELNMYNDLWLVCHGTGSSNYNSLQIENITANITTIDKETHMRLSLDNNVPEDKKLSIGVTSILLAKNLYPDCEIHIIGFDSYQTGLYFETSLKPLTWRPEGIERFGRRRRIRYHRNKQDNDWKIEKQILYNMERNNEITYI